MNHWKLGLVALISAVALVACPSPTPPPPGPPAPPPPPATITVAGTIVDGSGAPVSGVSVQLNNAGTPATTDVQGQFSFSSVTTPYTLTAKSLSGGTTYVIEYRGLTRTNPQIATTGFGSIGYSANIAGTVTGPTYPLPAGNSLVISATNGAFSLMSGNTTNGNYSGSAVWTGGPTKTTDLVALRTSGSLPTLTYLQTGKRAGVALAKGIGQSGLNIPLDTAVASGTTTLSYTLGAYTTTPNSFLLNVRVNGAPFLLGLGGSFASGTSFNVPNEGSVFAVTGDDGSGNGATVILPGVVGGSTNVSLPATVVLKNSLPSNTSTNVSKRPAFSWSPVSGANMYSLTLNGPSIQYTIYLPASSSNLTLPDYAGIGAALVGSTAYNWNVSSFQAANLGSSDILTDPAGGSLFLTYFTTPTAITAFNSGNTNFTTAP